MFYNKYITSQNQATSMRIYLTCIIISCIVISIKGYSQNCDMEAAENRRVQIVDIKPPFSFVVQMTMKRGKSYNGTAFFIHPRVLLTAGHNIRKRPQFYFTRVKRLTLRVGATNANTNLRMMQLETNQDVNIFTNHFFNREYSIEKDFGLIILPDTQLYQIAGGHFRLTVYDSAKIAGKVINLAGYPGDRPFCSQWHDSTLNHFYHNWHLHYDFATEHGASGSPIWYTNNGEHFIFGIHTNGDRFDQFNCTTSTLITKEIFEEIRNICRSNGIEIPWLP
jgi:V8-like Glu-specific endopeptidase